MYTLQPPIFTILLVIVCLSFGYIWGVTFPSTHQYIIPASNSNSPSSPTNTETLSGPQLRTVDTLFAYNATFGQRPSPATNHVWNSLFPHQAGFFRHPTIAPDRSTFSAFHQLHCLDGLRQGYWALYDAATTEGNVLRPDEVPMMASPSHVRHCIDLLRRSVMCQPDLTVEVKDEELGGVRGFGTVHQCKDWDALVEWTSRWETHGQMETDGKGLQGSAKIHENMGKHDEQ